MKKTILFASLVSIIMFAGCGHNDNKSMGTTNPKSDIASIIDGAVIDENIPAYKIIKIADHKIFDAVLMTNMQDTIHMSAVDNLSQHDGYFEGNIVKITFSSENNKKDVYAIENYDYNYTKFLTVISGKWLSLNNDSVILSTNGNVRTNLKQKGYNKWSIVEQPSLTGMNKLVLKKQINSEKEIADTVMINMDRHYMNFMNTELSLKYEGVSKWTHPLFLSQSPDFLKPGLCYVVKFLYLYNIKFKVMQRYHFRPYSPNQTILFPQRIDKDIAENDPVRLISSIVESLDLGSFRRLYKERGRSPYDPKMLLKVVIYAYMNNIYSCRRIEKALKRDIHFIWLAGYEQPDFITINRFRNRVKDEINNVFTQLVLLLSVKGLVSLDVEYIDGTKIESKANKYTFVWRKTVEKNRAKLMEKIRVLLFQVDEAIAQDKAAADEAICFTPETLTEIAEELRQSLSEQPAPKSKEEKKAVRERQKRVRQIEKMRDKLSEYDSHLETLGERNSYSKTDPDATFMRMKEDAMNNGQTKPGYNLQIGTENQFITDFGFFHNPTDTLTMIPFLNSFSNRYDRFAEEICADSGYGSEENYSFMEAHDMEAYVKYNLFHKEQKRAFKNDIFRIENLYYNPEGDYFVCPMGQHMERVGTHHGKTDSGYRTQTAVYRAQRCEGCPLRWGCYKKRKGNRETEVNHRLMEYKRKARELLTSERGLEHRSNRPIEPEAVFGQMKYNMHYKRFRHFGKDKITMDFAFFAIAFNIKKMAAKLLKQGNMPVNGDHSTPFEGSYIPIRHLHRPCKPENINIAA